LELIKFYRLKIENELSAICKDVIELLADILIPNSTVPDATVFYKKMRGDYYRYLCEFTYNER
jgi:14-3-3 protein epsilon